MALKANIKNLETWRSIRMQYYKPEGEFFVGDPMPFFLEDTFHLYYLVDENHHQGKNGLGGHYWAHSSTKDLIHWEHHSVAIPLGENGTYDQNTICTGSVFYHEGIFYAPYATRILDGEGHSTEHLCWATSTDGFHFTKDPKNPTASPPIGYHRKDYRDPFIFRDEKTGLFHMLITAYLDPEAVRRRSGCIAQLVSRNLKDWEHTDPFICPGVIGAPECPDYFYWNGWYYLTFLSEWRARVRMSREPYGPWLRPPVDSFDGLMTISQKSAQFTGNRRISVAFLPTRTDNKDNGHIQYGGNAIFREMIQNEDGTLGCKFPPEMIPLSGDLLHLDVHAITPGVVINNIGDFCLNRIDGFELAVINKVPVNARITLNIIPNANSSHFGLCLRGDGAYEQGYEIRFSPYDRMVKLYNITLGEHSGNNLSGVQGLDKPFRLDIIMKDDIIDVCIDDKRCIINRFPESNGNSLFFFCENGGVTYQSIEIRQLISK